MSSSMCILWLVVHSLGGLLTLLLPPPHPHGVANSLSSLSPFSYSSIRDPALSPMVGGECLLLYLSDSVRASKKTAIQASISKHFPASGFGKYI